MSKDTKKFNETWVKKQSELHKTYKYDIETIIVTCVVGSMCLVTIFVMVILPIILTKKYNEEQKKKKLRG